MIYSRIHKIVLLAGVFWALGSTCFAGDFTKAKYAGEFLSVGVGARALGIGGAFVAVADDVTGIYWNPAGLSRVSRPEIMFMHADRFAGVVKYDFAAAVIPHNNRVAFGIGLVRLGVDDIPHTTLPRQDLQVGEIYVDDNGNAHVNEPFVEYAFSNGEYGLFLSFSKMISRRFSYGGSVKIVHKSFDVARAWGVGFDLAAQYRLDSGLRFGANFQDATTTILAWNSGRKEVLVPTLKLGAAFPFQVEMLPGRLLPVIDFDVRFDGRKFASQAAAGFSNFDTHVGLEFEANDFYALRIGSNAGFFVAGAGLTLGAIHVDYAFQNHSDLGDIHRISLKMRWGKKVKR